MGSKYAFQAEKLKTMFETPWMLRLPAARVFGNLYFVGNRDGASWLVETEEGLILLDTNYPTAGTLLINAIWSLGFDPGKIIAVFHTHGHFDHFGSTALIKNLSGAKTYLGREDARMFRQRPELALIQDSRGAFLEVFQPDVEVNDGDEFTFGTTKLRCVACPGHSPGATSYFFNVSDGQRTLMAGLHGGAGLNTLCADFREQYGVDWRKDFRDSIRKVLEEPVDIFLGNHTGQNRTEEKLERLVQEPMAFVCPGEWKRFLLELENRFCEMEEDERRAGMPDVENGIC